VKQAILPAFTVAGIVDAGFSREHLLLRARIIGPGYSSSLTFVLDKLAKFLRNSTQVGLTRAEGLPRPVLCSSQTRNHKPKLERGKEREHIS